MKVKQYILLSIIPYNRSALISWRCLYLVIAVNILWWFTGWAYSIYALRILVAVQILCATLLILDAIIYRWPQYMLMKYVTIVFFALSILLNAAVDISRIAGNVILGIEAITLIAYYRLYKKYYDSYGIRAAKA